jgi:hypothetical protein
MPADVLAHVYEQFLGKVIRLTAGHQAKVEERSKGLVPARALDRPSAPRKLSAMPCEPRPALTEVELFIMSPELTRKPVVPDHKLMLVECLTETEAHYLCAALNCSPSRMVVAGYTIAVSMDPHIMEHVRIPKYNPKDKVHKRLAELSMQAHELARTPAGSEPSAVSGKLEAVEAQVDLESAKLWNLTAADLAEIQRSLKELTE